MRALVIGGGGFVGKYLVRHLLESGDEVVATTNEGNSVEGCETLALDITDPGPTGEIIQRVRPEVIYHLAAIAFVPQAESNFEQTLMVNVGGTATVARQCQLLGNNAALLLVSSAEVYGLVRPNELPIHEESPLRPMNNYSLSKRMAELVVERYDRQGGVRCSIVRPFNHIGPGQDSRFVASNFALQLARVAHGLTSPVLEVGNLEARRDFSDVRDIVRAYRRIATTQSGVFNLGAGESHSIQELLDTLIEVAGVTVEIRKDPTRMRGPEVPDLYTSYEKASRLCGWKPTISFRQSLKDVYDHWFEAIARDKAQAVKAMA